MSMQVKACWIFRFLFGRSKERPFIFKRETAVESTVLFVYKTTLTCAKSNIALSQVCLILSKTCFLIGLNDILLCLNLNLKHCMNSMSFHRRITDDACKFYSSKPLIKSQDIGMLFQMARWKQCKVFPNLGRWGWWDGTSTRRGRWWLQWWWRSL